MKDTDIAERYVEAWNEHDPQRIVDCFAPGGTYEDPATGGALTGEAIADYARGLFEAFPDVRFDVRSTGQLGENRLASEWTMRGTHRGPYRNLPPTGSSVELPGTDVLELGDGRIESLRGYFDRQALQEQMGLQVLVQPEELGPATFGWGAHFAAPGDGKPGAVSLTKLRASSEEAVERVQQLSRSILREDLVDSPGFLGFYGGAAGRDMFTVTAWEDVDAVGDVLASDAHQHAVGEFRDELAEGGVLTVWVPERMRRLVRCQACGTMAEYGRHDRSCPDCEADLPEPPDYW